MSQATPASMSYTNSNLFSGYYLDERVDSIDAWDCDEEARAVFEELQALWHAERDLVESYNENELLGSWIDPVLDALGYDWLSETTLPDGGGYNDRLLFDSTGKRREAAVEKRDGHGDGTYGLASALLEAKQWDAAFTERFAEERSYRDASHQVKYYLERTPDDLGWGVLTNGRTWRLYGTKDYETSTYYEIEREGETTVTIRLSARYKPDDGEGESEDDLDRWGYTETDPLPALRITDLTATEADLICAFVPVAVEEAGGFANFRETATKTNSLVDRLEKLTLPVLSDVESGLQRYIDTRERAAELDEKIERTDQLIDEIVYELYGLTDEEIEIVEEAVGGE